MNVNERGDYVNDAAGIDEWGNRVFTFTDEWGDRAGGISGMPGQVPQRGDWQKEGLILRVHPGQI